MSWVVPQRPSEQGPADATQGSSHRTAATPVPRERWGSGVLLGAESPIPSRACNPGAIPSSWTRTPMAPRCNTVIVELFGPAASGKTTLARGLEAALDARGIAVRLVGSSRPAEKGSEPPGAGARPSSALPAALARASKVFTALDALVPGVSIDPLVGQLMEILPPKSWTRAIRARRYLRNICGSWSAALTSDSVVIFDQGFMNSLCSLALFSGALSQHALSRGLSLVPAPDLLIRVETPREVLQARLEKRLRRQGVFERLFESDIQRSLRQIEISSMIDDLLKAVGRHSMRVSWRDQDTLAMAVETIADEIILKKGHGSR
nr:AAA family ATPase [Ensifer sp. ENS12]